MIKFNLIMLSITILLLNTIYFCKIGLTIESYIYCAYGLSISDSKDENEINIRLNQQSSLTIISGILWNYSFYNTDLRRLFPISFFDFNKKLWVSYKNKNNKKYKFCHKKMKNEISK